MTNPPLQRIRDALSGKRLSWLVTGSAGFIGSHLVEKLLTLNQSVVGLDNFSTGHRENLCQVEEAVGPQAWKRHRFIEGSIADLQTCREACRNADLVLHQAALGSVPRSIADPLATHAANVTGFANVLVAARDARARRFVYASSIGPRQDPEGAYAAVIPRWIRAMLRGEAVEINGDGETTRDFCFVANAVQANLLAALTGNPQAVNQVYNVAVGESTSLNELFEILRSLLAEAPAIRRVHRPFREGDVRHSRADIRLARRLLGYEPTHTLSSGLREALPWYARGSSTAAALQ